MSSIYVLGDWKSVLVEVHTDEGLVGVGEAECYGTPQVIQTIIETVFRPELLGENPFDIERLWMQMYRRSLAQGRKGYVLCAISGIDIALWDILGQFAGLPVFRLLGAYTDKVQAYASGGFYAAGKELDQLVDEMQTYVAAGFQAVKMKIGRDTSDLFVDSNLCRTSMVQDLDRVAAVCEAVGPGVKVLVDANTIWDAATAIQIGRKLQELGVYLLEEPVSPDDIEGSAAVAAALDLLVAGYETDYTRFGFRDLIENRAVDVVQADVIRAGGFTECRRIAACASAHHLNFAPHVFGTGISLMASMHFLASLPNASLLEAPQVANRLRTELLTEPIKFDQQGYAHLTEKPGLGVMLSPDAVEKFTLK